MISFLSWGRLQPIWGAISTEIKVFNENILPAYTVDQFESQFRMTRGTFELLCREVQATGRVPQQHAFGRPPIPLDKQVLAFVWFIANSEVIRSVQPPYFLTEDLVESGLELEKNFCETRKWNTQFHRKIPNGKTGLPFQKFNFVRKFSSGTNQKITFRLQPNRNFQNLLSLVNGKHPQYICYFFFENVANEQTSETMLNFRMWDHL